MVQVVRSVQCLPSDQLNPDRKQRYYGHNLEQIHSHKTHNGHWMASKHWKRMKTQLTVDPLAPFCPWAPCWKSNIKRSTTVRMSQSGKIHVWSIRNGTYRNTRWTRRAERTLETTSTLITDNKWHQSECISYVQYIYAALWLQEIHIPMETMASMI